ncbi:MAG TPA: branched-chain amino acid ABC transporter ATP-binding protein/permease [Baekduia sp.]|jgi:branched-chain amino acid transport system permease protein|nr:branched-chain amino acid ABC transporter ATP-binding protein/permease [Baekduia sp.]
MTYWIDILDQILIFSIFATSLNLLMGHGGQVSAAHAGFGAVGGYGAAYLAQKHGVSFVPSVLIGVALALVAGLLLSLPAMKLSGEYLILLTLTAQTVALVVISSVEGLGSEFGLTEVPAASLFGHDFLRPKEFLPLLAVVAVGVWIICGALAASGFGRTLRGIRDDEIATQALGKNTFLTKVAAFSIASALAGLGGALLVYYNGIAAPGLFGFDVSMSIIVMVVLGGSGNLLGALLGTTFVVGSAAVFEKVINLEPEKAGLSRLLAYGLALTLVLLLRPQGILPPRAGGARWRFGRKAAGAPAPVPADEREHAEHAPASLAPPPPDGRAAVLAEREPPPVDDGPVPAPILELRGLSKAFGGVQAVHDLTFALPEGRTTALIGPNGAGKTTIFNLITGTLEPDAGQVLLRGDDITAMPMHQVARRGVARTFQDVRIFGRISALENVRLAVPGRARNGQDDRSAIERAREQLAFVGLEEHAGTPVADLAFGDQKLVSLARVLATGAEVILLDEPASGIDARWLEKTLDLMAALREQGKTVCIVEHNLEVVERLADHVVFLEAGTVTAEGTMQELKSQSRLVEAYFGMA